jgi:peptidyl-prolyl cis-trans isomerase C
MTNQVHAVHILVKTEQEAKEILSELKRGMTFQKLAETKSTCPSGKKGGDLGWFGRGQMVRPFELAAFGMEKGSVSEPIKTQFGWHIIKVLEKK